MALYNVHLYREMRLFFQDIEAETPEAAAATARAKPTPDADYVEDCHGLDLAALVDVAGDEEFLQSVTIDFEAERIRKAAPMLLAALQAIVDYAENEATSLESLNDDPETAAEADRAWKAVAAAHRAVVAAKAVGLVPARAEIDLQGALDGERQRQPAPHLLEALQRAEFLMRRVSQGDHRAFENLLSAANQARKAIAAAETAVIAVTPADIDVQAVLAGRRQIAELWGVLDVRTLRPDLTEAQAWNVLQAARRQYDPAVGMTWDVLRHHAETLCGAAPATGTGIAARAASGAPEPRPRPYSVLLLYPDYANDSGAETYYSFVHASDAVQAVAEARRQAAEAQEGGAIAPDDFVPLLVTDGHHRGEVTCDR